MNRPLSELTREELEAKVTALVLGELDAAEAASMEALLARDAALAEWKRTLESALESVREASRTPAEPLSDVPVAHRMSEPRRSTLLERLRQADAAGASREANAARETSPAARGFDRPDARTEGGSVIVPFPRSRAYGLLAAAAGLVVLLGWATWTLEDSMTQGTHFALSDPEGILLRETSTRYRRTFGWQWGTNSSEAQLTQDQPMQAAGSGGAGAAAAGVDKLEEHSLRFGKAATAGQSGAEAESRMQPRTLSRGRPAVTPPPPPAAVTARRYTLAPKTLEQEQLSPLAIAGDLAANGRPVLGDAPAVGRLLRAEAPPPSPTKDVAPGSSAGGRAATHFYSNAGVPVPSALSSIEAKTKSDNQPVEAVDARRDAAPVELHFRAELRTSEDSLRVLSEDRALAQDRGGAFDTLSDGVPVSRLTDVDRAAGKQAALGTRLEAVNGVVLEQEILRKGITLSRANPIPELEEAVGEVDTAGRPEVAQVESLSRKAVNPEVATAELAVSTFSLNVSDASFRSVDAWLGQGQPVDPNAVRAEEFLNAFEYRDPLPPPGARVGFTWERARHPFAHQRDLIRMAVRTAATGREPGRPFNVVLLLDASGSMERPDRLATVRAALGELAKVLGPGDRVSVVAFARTARVWVDGLAGEQAGELPARVGELLPEGGTNLEEALRVAYETARRHFQSQGENHVVLLTDGVTNLGEQRAEVLRAGIESERRRGIALDCFGIGLEGLGDALLEVLARHGDGRYAVLNSPEDAAQDFATKLAGALNVAAADVKVQVEFNPARVTAWRQIGYEQHQLTQEQFRDNTVDAAELAGAEAGNALYVVATEPQGTGPIAVVRARFRVPGTARYEEHAWTIPYAGVAADLERASEPMRLAAVAGGWAELLAGSPHAAEVRTDVLLRLMRGVPAAFAPDPRPARLESMLSEAKSAGYR